MKFSEARTAWQQDASQLAARGIIVPPSVLMYTPDEFKGNYALALDSQPTLITDPNSGVPAILTTMIDPTVLRIMLSPNKAAEIFGEVKKGDWLQDTTMFPTIEYTGEVASYGDFAESGKSGANTNWPQRQSYLYQTIVEYGERELERAGLGRINWVSELNASAANSLNKASNYIYFFGVQGLQNYGLLNDPGLSAPITPSTKAYGGTKWISNGAIVASPNEIYADIEAIFYQLVTQTAGLIDRETKMTLALDPGVDVALTATNSFNVNVADLLKKNFPGITVETAKQYGVLSASNPQGVAAGNLVQLIVDNVDGQDVGYCAFNEKMRAHSIIKALSSFKQKMTSGSWGAIVRVPAGIAAMVGV
jgi:hypothetical protein